MADGTDSFSMRLRDTHHLALEMTLNIDHLVAPMPTHPVGTDGHV